MTDAHVIERDGFDALVDVLGKRGYTIIGPTVRDGAIVYDEISSAAGGDQRVPQPPSPADSGSSVCVECKRRGTLCVMVAHGTPCLGPVTHAGCGALCPAYDRGWYGCYGPKETPNTASLNAWSGLEDIDIVRVYRTFNAWADGFRQTSEAHERR